MFVFKFYHYNFNCYINSRAITFNNIYYSYSSLVVLIDDVLLIGDNPWHNLFLHCPTLHAFCNERCWRSYHFLVVQFVCKTNGLFYDDTSMFMIVSRSFIFTLSNWCTNCTCFSDDFTLIDGELLVNPSGCWAWLAHYSTSMIRLDITNIVHVIFWFMHTFHTTYMHVMKRVFTYLQGKTEHGLSFKFQGKLKNEFFHCIVMLIRLMPIK